mgnify:CR=1 FL=1
MFQKAPVLGDEDICPDPFRVCGDEGKYIFIGINDETQVFLPRVFSWFYAVV